MEMKVRANEAFDKRKIKNLRGEERHFTIKYLSQQQTYSFLTRN